MNAHRENRCGTNPAPTTSKPSFSPPGQAKGDQIYEDARAFCYGIGREAARPFVREQLADFSAAERLIIDRIAEWMGSRDCDIARLTSTNTELLTALKQIVEYEQIDGIGHRYTFDFHSPFGKAARAAIAKAEGR